jgi:hypothetical protein
VRRVVPLLIVGLVIGCGGGKARLDVHPGIDGGRDEDAGFDAGGRLLLDAGGDVDAGADAGSVDDAGVGDSGYPPPTCTFSATPASVYLSLENVSFPLADGGFYVGLFTITNTGVDACPLPYPALTPGSDPAFTLPAPPMNDAGFPAYQQVEVWFDPPSPGVYSGGISLGLVDPSGPQGGLRFTVSVDNGTPCLLFRPAALNFGTVPRGPCPAENTVSFEAINSCAQSVTVQSVTLSDGSVFSVPDGQTPTSVAQGGTAPLSVNFAGGEDGTYTDTLTVQTDLRSQPFTLSLSATVAPGTLQTDAFTFEGNYLFTLTGTPDRDGPSLSVNGTVLREGYDWSYDPLTTILAIDSTRRPLNLGDQIAISYHLACD